jgi:hypothetical protein
MSKSQHARRPEGQRRAQSRRRIRMVGIGVALLVVVGIIMAVWQTGANENTATGATNAIGSQLSEHPTENDVAGLQAAESGTVGKPVLVWFHADW